MLRNILFVDDDEILQLAVEKGLAAHDGVFGVVLARDGFEALKKLENISVSLAVIDLQMPRMDGLSLLSHIRESYPDIPVILISATPKEKVSYLLEMQGIVGYLEKPFAIDELAKPIIEALQAEAAGGVMHNASPTMFLQLMEMEGKTCTIRILDSDSMEGGILYLKDGRLLDVRVGKLRGTDGAYRVFSWDEVTVYFHNECPDIEDRINSDLQAIIMGALAAKDEADDSPFADSEGPVAGFARLGPADENLFGSSPADSPTDESAWQPALGGLSCERDDSSQDGISTLLRRELGDMAGVSEPRREPCLDQVVVLLTEVGRQMSFGELRIGHIDGGETEDMQLLVPEPGRQATVLRVDRLAPLATIMDVLRYRE